MDRLPKKVAFAALFVALVLPATTCGAAPDSLILIEHLLMFVERSGCTFIRNGAEHTPEDAARHMKKKYDYFREKIHSPEDFIALTATKSTMTGKPYLVRCGSSDTILAADWLKQELEVYRTNPAKGPP